MKKKNKTHRNKPVARKRKAKAAAVAVVLVKKVSRQREWQKKQSAAGMCWKCGDPAIGALCLRHTKLERERQRKLRGWKRRNRTSLSYQM